MSECEWQSDYELRVTVRVYGPGTGEEAARALADFGQTFNLAGESEVEILAAEIIETHQERSDTPGWDTKVYCTCGHQTASRAEMWKHQADALRAAQ